jgi:uncharacterized protein (DUF169 family)
MNEKLKSTFITSWKRYFQEAPQPIAIFFSNELHNAEPAKKHEAHHCIMADLMRVSRGQSLAFSAENIGCGGGMRYCGYAKGMRPGFEFFLSTGIPGKMEGERYKKDPETVLDSLKKNPAMEAPASWMIAKPFDMLEPDDEPEVVIFFASPDVLSGLFTLANFDRSDVYGVKAPFGPGCGSVIHYPWLENKRENPDCIIGLFDPSARPYVKDNLLSFAIPMKRFEKLVGYMDESFLITKAWNTMQKRISKRLMP